MTPKFQRVRAKGGFLTHYKPVGSWTALCGHAPQSNAFLMRSRAGWVQVAVGLSDAAQAAAESNVCKKCAARLPADAVIQERVK